MTQINDVKYAALKALLPGVPGTINDLERLWLVSHTGMLGPIPDLYREFYRVRGFTSGSLNDRAKLYLNDLGYTGTLTDMWKAYWEDGGEVVVEE